MYVYSNNEGFVLDEVAGGNVMMQHGDVWMASHPFVASRLDLFSATPTRVFTVTGWQSLPPTPVALVEVKKAARTRA